jgi:hypothetical protein
MKLRYETGTATMIQFAVITLVALLTQTRGVIEACLKSGSDCVSDSVISLMYVIILGLWLGFVSVIGYAAEDRRSKRLAQLLLVLQVMILGPIMMNIRGSHNIFDRFGSLIDLAVCVWVMLLAWRLMRANGGRIVKLSPAVAATRPRRRPAPVAASTASSSRKPDEKSTLSSARKTGSSARSNSRRRTTDS